MVVADHLHGRRAQIRRQGGGDIRADRGSTDAREEDTRRVGGCVPEVGREAHRPRIARLLREALQELVEPGRVDALPNLGALELEDGVVEGAHRLIPASSWPSTRASWTCSAVGISA